MDGLDWTRLDLALVAAAAIAPAPPPSTEATRKTNSAARRRERRELASRGEGLAHGQNPLTSEIDYTADELEFSLALDRYRRQKRRPYPTNREVLAVLKGLGYRKFGTEAK